VLFGLALFAVFAVAACSDDDSQQEQAAQPSVAQAEQQSEQQQDQPAAQQPQAQQEQAQQAAQPEQQQQQAQPAEQQQEQPAAEQAQTQEQQAQQQTQPQAEQADDVEKATVVFSDLNWTSSEIQVRAAAFIVEHGYGYPTELVAGDTVSLWQGLINGDTQVTMEIWPAQQPWIDELDEGVIELLGNSLDENWEGWVVPQYVKDANPGLVSVADLPEYMELFVTADSRGRARFIDCVPGWACEQVNGNKLIAYGLEDVLELVKPGSGAALFEDLESTYDRGEPWLGYMWGPTKPTATLDLYRLEEPEWTEECWNGDQGCAYPASEVRIAVNTTLLSDAPDVVEFLRAWDFAADVQVLSEIWMSENNASTDEAAIWYLMTYPEVWSAFVPDDVAAAVQDALAEAS
jgi:glycine betaine/proline transport system substrate-binding protein